MKRKTQPVQSDPACLIKFAPNEAFSPRHLSGEEEDALAADISPHDLRHRFDHRMVEVIPQHRLAQIMGHDALDTTMLYIRGTRQDLQ